MTQSDDVKQFNRLANETSPYLLQHKANPVDWYPWGPEALAKARKEDKPIFLSVGYSSCHWCHVMERESFENTVVAEVLNRHFVSIKVDREERPDIDEVYMKAVQMLTGTGGWPMSVFLTPDLEPFYGGTYFPPTDRYGRPGFLSVLAQLSKTWRESRDRAIDSGRQLTKHVRDATAAEAPAEAASGELVAATVSALEGWFDPRDGGFGGAPKFPHPMDLAFLLRVVARCPPSTSRDREADARLRTVIDVSLEKMGRGGIFDQLGGGFHRYATDEKWLVPHFEKMLYDNALLAPVYAEAARHGEGASRALFARIARQTCDYVVREMTDPDGGFWSATDADSEGEEGKFFVWKKGEVVSILGRSEGDAFCRYFGLTDGGNFEHGANVLEQIGPEEERHALGSSIEKLLAVRAKRVPPGLDDKVLVEWNGLMIAALARCGALLGESRWVAAAERAAGFLLDRMLTPHGLLRSYRRGDARIKAFLSDHANLIHGLLEVAAVSPDARWLDAALRLTRDVRARFASENGGFFATASDHEALIVRSRDPYDNATPSGNSVMASNLLRLAHWTGEESFFDAARRTIESFVALAKESPAGFGWMMQAVELLLNEPTSVVIVGPRGDEGAAALSAAVHARFRPGVFALRTDGTRADEPGAPALLRGKTAKDGRSAAYVCSGATCLLPITAPVELERALDSAAASGS